MGKPFFYELETCNAFLANMTSRLSKMINDDFTEVLKNASIVTPVTDVSLIIFLGKAKRPSIAEVAEALSYSHQRTASRASALEKLSLIKRHPDKDDARCQRLSLTTLGLEDLSKLERVTTGVADVISDISQEKNIQLMKVLFELCESIDKKPISKRLERISTMQEED